MPHTPEYEKLLVELKAGELPVIARKILDMLSQASKGLTRQGLIRIVFGEEPGGNLSMTHATAKSERG